MICNFYFITHKLCTTSKWILCCWVRMICALFSHKSLKSTQFRLILHEIYHKIFFLLHHAIFVCLSLCHPNMCLWNRNLFILMYFFSRIIHQKKDGGAKSKYCEFDITNTTRKKLRANWMGEKTQKVFFFNSSLSWNAAKYITISPDSSIILLENKSSNYDRKARDEWNNSCGYLLWVVVAKLKLNDTYSK